MTEKELATPLSEEMEAFLLSEEAANLFTEEQMALLGEEAENLFDQDELLPEVDGGPQRRILHPQKNATRPSRYTPLSRGMMIIFLLALGGAGFYYWNRDSGPEVSSPSVWQKPVVKVPSVPVEPRADLGVEGGFSAKVADNPISEGQGSTGDLKPANQDQPKVLETELAQTVVEEEALQSDSGQAPTEAGIPESRPAAHYALQLGIFLRQSSAKKAAEAIGKLGYRPEVTAFNQEVEMTRVRLTTLPIKEARSFLAAMQPKIPNAFLIIDGQQASVYAGSFRTKQRARRLMGRLKAEGIDSKEVAAVVQMTMHKVTFGDFADEAAARTAGEKVLAAGFREPELVARSVAAGNN